MLSPLIIRSKEPLENGYCVSRKIEINNASYALLQIRFHDAKLGKYLETTIIDTLIVNQPKNGDIYAHFSFLLEKMNRGLRDLEKDYDLAGLEIFISIVESNVLHFSIVGKHTVYLIKNGKIIDIAEGMGEKMGEFSYISSGNVESEQGVYIATADLLDIMTEDDLVALAEIDNEAQCRECLESFLAREPEGKSVEVVFLSGIGEESRPLRSSFGDNAFDKMAKWSKKVYKLSKKHYRTFMDIPQVREAVILAQDKLRLDNKPLRNAMFFSGLIVSGIFLYLIIGSFLSVRSGELIPEAYKNKLIEARLIIERSSKDLGNRDAFMTNVQQAENLIYEVRDKKIFMNDVKKLLEEIALMKKQLNRIESFNPKNSKAEYVFSDKNFQTVGIFEVAKKYYFVGKNAIVGPYVQGVEAKSYPYPDGEEAIAADIAQDGSIFVLTKTNRILRYTKGNFGYANVEGQKIWEKAKQIRTFNGNLYLLSEDGNAIYKHKPGVNGFSAKSTTIDNQSDKKKPVIDFGIDGGFYLLQNDLMIDKVFTVPTYNRKSIQLNGLPDNYKNTSSVTPKIVIGSNLTYVYLLMDNRVWLFEPDTRDYKSVRALKYVGQIEVVGEDINGISIIKDGMMLASTKESLYRVEFEISDGKIIVRNN